MIFVDAGAFIARFRTSDDFHATAISAWKTLERSNRRCFTNDLVVAEVAKAIGRAAGNAMAAQFVRHVLNSDMVVLRGTPDEEEDAAGMLIKFADQQVGFTDCVSFVQMKRNHIRQVFGFDRHFQLAGFALWPGFTK